MDVIRKGAGKARMIRRIVYAVIALITIPLITWGLSLLKPAAPPVDRAAVWIDGVKGGPMLRQGRGWGALCSAGTVWAAPAPCWVVGSSWLALRPPVHARLRLRDWWSPRV